MNLLEITNAKNLICKMPLNTLMELTEIYGTDWGNISSPTTFGKAFKAEYDNGTFLNLEWCDVKENGPNHERYKRIK